MNSYWCGECWTRHYEDWECPDENGETTDTDMARVFVERHEQRSTVEWWRVRVQYPGSKPHTLLSVPTEDEAVKAARGYAAKYGWVVPS